MSGVRAPQRHTKTAAEVCNVTVDFSPKLDDGELLTGTPTVTDASSGLTISGASVNTTGITVNGSTLTAGQAVQFVVASGSVNTMYVVRATCGTDAGQTRSVDCPLWVTS